MSIPLKSEGGQTASFNVITDPVEGDLNAILYPRQTKFALPIEKVPPPDVYLLSHNHLDHYSKDTVKKLFAQQPIMIVPQGDKSRYSSLAKELGFGDMNIIELDWWEKRKITFEKNGEIFSMQISATPARHWSGQGPCGGHESTFLGYVIQGHEDGDIYFAGDTARLNDDHIKKLRDHFRIKWSFQPGGPDEVRKDMESTHQASVDGLWMHFKMMIPRIYEKGMDKDVFLRQAKQLKTIYMHTMTYKLGNLHISDSRDSLNNVLNALESDESLNLKIYEKKVYDELRLLADDLDFQSNKKLLYSEVALLLRDTVIVPKIGSRIGLKQAKTNQTKNVYF
jgi:L-ascorbate metabolism protein UlaG (beta-lactamase superfamily)